jgi:hypothetical protein
MGIIPGRREIIEEILNAKKIDPVTCREKFKGIINEQGDCLVRLIIDPSKPNEVKLEKIEYVAGLTSGSI